MKPTDAIFTRDGAWFVPTELARGPWHPNSQHGSAMSGLIARALEGPPGAGPTQLARLTIDLLRAAPFEPVKVKVDRRHAGKTVEFVEVELLAGDAVCARAHAVCTRLPEGPWAVGVKDSAPLPAFDPADQFVLPPGQGLLFHDALQLSPVEGFKVPALWMRMVRPLVQDEDPSPLVRVAVAADWAYACETLHRWAVDPEGLAARPFVAINVDNHVVLSRPPTGEWVGLSAAVGYGPGGAGVAHASVFDRSGCCGAATQTLVQRSLDKRPKAWT